MNHITIEEILWKLRIENLTAMQLTAIEKWRKGKDLVLLSPTGSGKTLTYIIPLLQTLDSSNCVQAIIIVPSRELAIQIEQVFKTIGSGIPVMSCYGGRPAMDEHRTMKSIKPRIIISTPGRLNDHLDKGNIESTTIQKMVIDEFDKCLELGFQNEMTQIINKLPSLKHRYLLSATDAPIIPDFVSSEDFVKLNFLNDEEQIPGRIKLYSVLSPEKDKLDTLFQLLCNLGENSSLVFVNYRESVERVFKYLKSKGIACEMFHGGMEQKDRERALYKFANGSCNVFVSTDLASRGLDIPDINHIIHYHLPLNDDAYIHRNGRTARWDAQGNAYIILGPEEEIPCFVQQVPYEYKIVKPLQQPSMPKWVTLYIGKGKKDKINKVDIVGFLSKVGGLLKDDIGRIDVKEHYAFVAIKREKLHSTLQVVKGHKIKGVKTIIEITR